MSAFSKIPPAQSVPDDVNVLIEIAAGSGSVKYEICKDTGRLCVDRFMPTAMHYPVNYGFVPNTLAGDGDPEDVLVWSPEPVIPGSVMRVRILGMLQMTDEGGEDMKLFGVPIVKHCAEFSHIQTMADVPEIIKQRIEHFFNHYKDLEPNKWVKTNGWVGVPEAQAELNSSIDRFKQPA